MLVLKKEIISFLVSSGFLYLFNQIYNFFGHGVISETMTYLWVLTILTSLFYTVLSISFPKIKLTPTYRMARNLLNTGVATFVVGKVLFGIFEIAGTSSPFTLYYTIIGSSLIALGIITCCYSGVTSTRYRHT